MGKVVNLNQFRKRKAREDKRERAAANRRKHGRTTAERAEDRKARELQERRVDGHKLDPGPGEDEEE